MVNSSKTKSADSLNPQYIAMPPETSTHNPPRVTSVEGTSNRELSWQVAANLFISFKYAWNGASYAFKTQRNFRLHTIIGTLGIALAIFLQLKPVEMAVIALTIGAVLAMELLNTAIESVVDLTVKQTYHELAKIAKDCAAAAVMVSAVASVVVTSFLILPPLMTFLSSALR